MKKITYIILALLIFSACEKENPEFKKNEKENPDYKENEKVFENLMEAYNDNSLPEFKTILDSWSIEIPSKSTEDLSSNTEENIYEIFQLVYSPFDIARLGRHEWGNMYEDYEYAVVQNKIFFDYSYDQYEADTRDSIMDFRPELDLGDEIPLYLTDNYSAALNKFLAVNDSGWVIDGGPVGISREEAGDRLEFLQEYLPIVPGHWGYYFHLETHPDVSIISFNDVENRAVAYFRVAYMFGQAYFSKNLVWEMDSSSITGIEK